MSLKRSARLVAALGAVVLAASCSGDGADSREATWPHTASPVATDGLIWATGDQVHLPDGSIISTGRLAGSYVVVGPGVWFASAAREELGVSELPPLRVATSDGVEETDAHPGIGSLTPSEDGRWLAFIDRLDHGKGPAEAVVIDVTSGEEVVRSGEGLQPSQSEGEDWVDLYEDSPVSVLGVVNDTAYVKGLNSLITYDLTSGESSSDDLDWSAILATDWWRSLDAPPAAWNADRSWRIPTQGDGATTVLVSAEGERITTDAPDATGPLGSPNVSGPPFEEWSLRGWLDDSTALALTPSRDGFSTDWSYPVLMACEVPSGHCEVIEGTEDGVNLPVDRSVGLPRGSTSGG